MYACTPHWLLHLAATAEALCEGHIFYQFSRLVKNPPNRQKLWTTPSKTIFLEVAFCSYGYCRNHVVTTNGAFQAYLVLYRRERVTLQNVHQNPSPVPPRMDTECVDT